MPRIGWADAWRAELHDGGALPDWLRRYLLCDCDIEVVWNENGIPVVTSLRGAVPRAHTQITAVISTEPRRALSPGHGRTTETGGRRASAIEMAVARRDGDVAGCIVHSDRGCNFVPGRCTEP